MVSGVVRDLQPSGIYVHVESGISGFVPLHELAQWNLESPEELFAVGDMVEAVIREARPRSKWLELSIRARMDMLEVGYKTLSSISNSPQAKGFPLPMPKSCQCSISTKMHIRGSMRGYFRA